MQKLDKFWQFICLSSLQYLLTLNVYSRQILKSQIDPRTEMIKTYIVASELKDPIWHSSEWQIGSFSSEATI